MGILHLFLILESKLKCSVEKLNKYGYHIISAAYVCFKWTSLAFTILPWPFLCIHYYIFIFSHFQVNARILFIDPSTRAVGLTMNPHLVHNNAPPAVSLCTCKFHCKLKCIWYDRTVLYWFLIFFNWVLFGFRITCLGLRKIGISFFGTNLDWMLFGITNDRDLFFCHVVYIYWFSQAILQFWISNGLGFSNLLIFRM